MYVLVYLHVQMRDITWKFIVYTDYSRVRL
jgi:hypothetical protein